MFSMDESEGEEDDSEGGAARASGSDSCIDIPIAVALDPNMRSAAITGCNRPNAAMEMPMVL